ncbi:MAG: hypothetical protein SV062_10460 [Thermodesulfobacteriota bacterium]|nr:hypothetical protein [Thermodesulfobacteriota bacterium]
MVNCPSKNIQGITRVLNDLGYLPLDKIDNIFFNYLTNSINNPKMISNTGDSNEKSRQLAYYAFYELKMVFQLRFFRRIWNTKEENWDNLKERKDDRDRGGYVWLGQDCIRVSNLEQAEYILKDSLEKNLDDYNVCCSLGFLYLEKNAPLKARKYFKKALDYARAKPQKIFIFLLLSRLYDLNNDTASAKDNIKKIIKINHYCPEALYQEVIYSFRLRENAVALEQLNKLIKDNREYYIAALIDPELGNFNDIIHPQLNNLFNEARDEAKKIVKLSEAELNKAKRLSCKKNKEVEYAQSLWLKIEELSKFESYFGCLDIIHYGNAIIKIIKGFIGNQRRKYLRTIYGLQHHLDDCLIFVNKFPRKKIIDTIYQQLQTIQKKIDKNLDKTKQTNFDQFNEASSLFNEITWKLDHIELKLKRLDTIRQVKLFYKSFFKKTLFIQSANLFFVFLLFPVIAHYLPFIMPEFKINPQNIWFYQQIVLIPGGISGLFLAIFLSVKNIS